MKKSLLILGSLVLMMGLLAGCSGEDLQGSFSDRGQGQVNRTFDASTVNLSVTKDGKFRAEFVNNSNVSSKTPLRMEIRVGEEVAAEQQVVVEALEEAMLITESYPAGTYGVTACVGYAKSGKAMDLEDAKPGNNCKALSLQVGE